MRVLIDDERSLLPNQQVPDLIARTLDAGHVLLIALAEYGDKHWMESNLELYLDHDLGEIEPGRTGIMLVNMIEVMDHETGRRPKKIVCVSSNPPGRAQIEAAVKKIYGRIYR